MQNETNQGHKIRFQNDKMSNFCRKQGQVLMA